MVLAAHGFYPESVPCFAEAERLDSQEPRWPYFRGIVLTVRDPSAAAPHLRRAVELCEPGTVVPRLRLAEALLGQDQSREASDVFREVLAHDPDNARAHLGLARVAYRQNDWPKSLTHLRRAVDNPLTRKAAHTLSAEVHRRRGDETAAERERRLAHPLPADAEQPDPFLDEWDDLRVGLQARLARAGRLLALPEADQAGTLLQQLVRDYPESASAWLGLGRALIKQKRHALAEQALRRAARLDAARVEVQLYLGVALFEQGRPREASAFFRRATELRPDYALAHYNLGQCRKAQGERAGAIGAYREAVRYQPSYAPAHANLGELLAEQGQRDGALQHLRLAVELDPDDARARGLLEKYRR
jgi:tetratricopeptide (TPR) repeat protein